MAGEELTVLLERWNREANEQTQEIVDAMIATMARCLRDDLHASDEQITAVVAAMAGAVDRVKHSIIRCDGAAGLLRMKTPHQPISLV